MPSPTSASKWSFVWLSGNRQIDSLLPIITILNEQIAIKWSEPEIGGVTSLTYSFPGLDATWTGYANPSEPWLGYSSLTVDEQKQALVAMNTWAAVADIIFTESVDNATTVGDIRFAFSSTDPHYQAWSYLPGYAAKASDIWFNSTETSFSKPWTEGRYEFETVVHELGHALGLKHPFKEPKIPNQTILASAQDYQWNTVMSYSARPGHQNWFLDYYPTTPMALDIQAMQYLYGANTTNHAGDDTYVFEQGSNYFETIWDAGGNDTFQYNATSKGGLIDLRPGHWSQLGQGIGVYDSHGKKVTTDFKTVDIYNTVIIENAVGSDFADKIYGNDVDNRLTGGDGNDLLDGGKGADFLDGGLGKDRLIGGVGNDHYVIDNVGDKIIETGLTDRDTVESSATHTLEKNLEDMTLTGSANINGYGNGLANMLIGNVGINTLDGRAGNDTVWGGNGNDKVIGGTGDDIIFGGTGTDILTGGKGADKFVFDTTPDATNIDTITDFTKGLDKIALEPIIFAAYLGISDFLSIETFPSTASSAHLIFQTSTRSLYYDNDGSGSNAAQLFVVLTGKVNLDANDVILA